MKRIVVTSHRLLGVLATAGLGLIGCGTSASSAVGTGGVTSINGATGGDTGSLVDSGSSGGSDNSSTGGDSSAGGSSNSAATGGTKNAPATLNPCLNAVQDGDETGVDCGGSCPPCVSYVLGAPTIDDTVKNACTDSGNVSFVCPRFMLFSPEMKQAAADDAKTNNWPAGSFNYGVATLNGANCCDCFQLVFDTPQETRYKFEPPGPLIVQNFNMGGTNNAFDIFMGKGGEGAQTNGCPKMYTSYPTLGEAYSGGIGATWYNECGSTQSELASAKCQAQINNQCQQIQSSSSEVTTTTQSSCIEANSPLDFYHLNWNVKAQRVECPLSLTEVTGCKLSPQGLPHVDPTVQTAAQAASWNSYTTTTMQDCCKPSCAWSGKAKNAVSGWSAVYQCDASGTPMHQ